MTKIVIESPYKATDIYSVQDNVTFARRICRYAILHGYAPYASHLFYTQPGILDDDIPHERTLGISAGLVWSSQAHEVWFCLRPIETEMSAGMQNALLYAERRGALIRRMTFTQLGEFVSEEAHV